MKIFDIEKYIPLQEESVKELMKKEYTFYRSITKPITLNHQDYLVSKHVNFQCRTSLKCNANCHFCIEKDSKENGNVLESTYVKALDESLSMIKEYGIYPTVTITGGEPCLNKPKLFGILDTLRKHGVKKFNLNTNGYYLDTEILQKINEVKMPYLNISRHHYDDEINSIIFNSRALSTSGLEDIMKEIGGTYDDNTRIRIQCVLMKGYIDSISEIKKFLEYIICRGLDNVAFRGLSKLKENEHNDVRLHRYCQERGVDIFHITSELKKDKDFTLVAQNISDHYTYEDWRYKDAVDIHFAYSDMDILEEYEKEELENGERFAREFVLYEDGTFCGGWNKDFKLIKDYSEKCVCSYSK